MGLYLYLLDLGFAIWVVGIGYCCGCIVRPCVLLYNEHYDQKLGANRVVKSFPNSFMLELQWNKNDH